MAHIRKLDPLVARRIAAGEVIDRPASVVRELVDNAIDAKPSHITLALENGGIDRITVIDDGSGIAPEDLPLCCESHATSKVATLDDLYHIRTMGFRGEALYSISAVSRTTISSVQEGKDPATIVVDNGESGPVVPGGPVKGTKVCVEGLFEAIPARKLFLKRPATEGQRCREVFLEKAIAYPSIAFTLLVDGQNRAELAPGDRKSRVVDVLALGGPILPEEMQTLSATAPRYSLYAVASTPALYRSDKSGIKIFVNDRPVDEYSMVQAVVYGYGELLPGGSFPYCYLFIDDDPTLVDFNIHPTKREVKIRNKAEVHHGVTTMLREQLVKSIPRLVAEEPVQPSLVPEEAPPSYPSQEPAEPANEVRDAGIGRARHAAPMAQASVERPIDPRWFEKAREILGHHDMKTDRSVEPVDIWTETRKDEEPFRYIGQAFNLFLIAEKGDDLFLVDQHAAHERILFNAIKAKKDVQPLLVPLSFEVEGDVDGYLEQNVDVYANLGIALQRTGDKLWSLSAVPALFKNIEPEVVKFVQQETGDAQEVEKGLYAVVACHKAIKQGDVVDRTTAIALLTEVFKLEDPVCPHGRTFVVRLHKQELMQAVGRVV